MRKRDSVYSFPEGLLDLSLADGRLRPRYLDSGDLPWVRGLRAEVRTLQGLPRATVEERLRRPTWPASRHRAGRAMTHLLLKMCGFVVRAPFDPSRLRRVVFDLAAAHPQLSREAVLARAADELADERSGVDAAVLAAVLYADTPAERVLAAAKELPGASELVQRYNLALARGLLMRSEALQVWPRDQVRALVREARLRGLLCLARASGEASAGRIFLELSGPLSLFRRTVKYGRALASWFPALLQAPGWALRARCLVARQVWTWEASHADGLSADHAPFRWFDSVVERSFFHDLRRLDGRWQVLREADPVQLGGHIHCPDFVLWDPGTGARVAVEIVGFWTPDYLRRKMTLLRALPDGVRWVVCADHQHAGKLDLAGAGLPLFLYRKRVDVAAFLRFLESEVAAGAVGAA